MRNLFAVASVILLCTQSTVSAGQIQTELTAEKNAVSGFYQDAFAIRFKLVTSVNKTPLKGQKVDLYHGETLLDSGTTDQHGNVIFHSTVTSFQDYEVKAIYNRAGTGSYARSGDKMQVHCRHASISVSFRTQPPAPNSNVFFVFVYVHLDEVNAAGQILGPLPGRRVTGGVVVPRGGQGNQGGFAHDSVTDANGNAMVSELLKVNVRGMQADLFGWHRPNQGAAIAEQTSHVILLK